MKNLDRRIELLEKKIRQSQGDPETLTLSFEQILEIVDALILKEQEQQLVQDNESNGVNIVGE
jgi:hypothetical protein